MTALSFFLLPFLQFALRRMKRIVFKTLPRTFLGYLIRLNTEAPFAWILLAVLWLVVLIFCIPGVLTIIDLVGAFIS